MMPLPPMLQPTSIRHLYLGFLSSNFSTSFHALQCPTVASLGILSGSSLPTLSLSLSLLISHMDKKKLSSQPGIPSCSLFYLLLLIPLLDTWYTCSPLLILVYAISLFTHDCPGSYRCFISSPSATRTINLLWVPLWRST